MTSMLKAKVHNRKYGTNNNQEAGAISPMDGQDSVAGID